MRPIKFRGRTLEGEWVYGSLILGNADLDKPQPAFISTLVEDEISFSILPVKVNRHSIGQFTGLKDKNGKEIYEGDIIQRHKRKYVVRWCGDNYISFELQYNGNGPFGKSQGFADFLKADLADTYEVIGNIYDNPELVTNDF